MAHKRFAIVLIAAALGGCASPHPLMKAGITASQRESDVAQCRYEAALAMAGKDSHGLVGAAADGISQAMLEASCLRARGYSRS